MIPLHDYNDCCTCSPVHGLNTSCLGGALLIWRQKYEIRGLEVHWHSSVIVVQWE